MIKSLERLIDQYTADINGLSPVDTNEPPLIVKQLTTKKISNDLISIKQQLLTFPSHKHYNQVNDKLNHLQYITDISRYNLEKIHRQRQSKNHVNPLALTHDDDTPSTTDSTANSTVIESNPTATGSTTIHDSEDITSLRKRLLSTSSIVPLQQVNNYHENIQQDLINDLSTLAGDLKLGAYNLSKKILDDNNLLSKTSDNLMKNNNLMDLVGDNLNSYVLNKSGGKILFWFLLKVLAFILTLFLVMIIIIKIFPKF